MERDDPFYSSATEPWQKSALNYARLPLNFIGGRFAQANLAHNDPIVRLNRDDTSTSSAERENDSDFTPDNRLGGTGLALVMASELGAQGRGILDTLISRGGDEIMRDSLIDFMFAIGLGAALCVGLAYCFPAIYLILGGSLGQFSSICLIALTIGVSIWASSTVHHKEVAGPRWCSRPAARSSDRLGRHIGYDY
jgi:hypothetical protein